MKLSALDFEEVIDQLPGGSFLFIDPPYFDADQAKFYNCTFDETDHQRLAACLERNADRLMFLLTYDDHISVRWLYNWASHLSTQEWNYTISRTDDQRNGKKKEDGFKSFRNKGLELFIRNYDI